MNKDDQNRFEVIYVLVEKKMKNMFDLDKTPKYGHGVVDFSL